jgi:hypothetical protein
MLKVTPFERGKDWPEALRLACTRYENAMEAAINAKDEQAQHDALIDARRARSAFGYHLLRLTRAR